MTFSRKRNALIVTALSLLLVFTCICPAFTKKQANADNIPISQRQVYYYSDSYNNYADLIKSQMQDIGMPQSNFNIALIDQTIDDFIIDIIGNATQYDYLYLQNAYIIFEIHGDLKTIDPDMFMSFSKKLDNMFSYLKNRNCKIMFLCDTDELLLMGNNGDQIYENYDGADFLKHVDFHINFDLIVWLVNIAVYRIDDFNQFTFFIDRLHFDDFKPYLFTYLRYKFELKDSNEDPLVSMQQIVNTLYANDYAYIYHEQTAQNYLLYGPHQTYSASQLLGIAPEIGLNVVFSSTVNNDNTAFDTFYYDMKDLYEARGGDFYIYNTPGIDIPVLSDLTDNITYMYYFPTDFSTFVLPSAIKAFLRGNSLDLYNNWFDNAAVTLKPIPMHIDGSIPIEYAEDAYNTGIPWLSIPRGAFNMIDDLED